LTFCRRIPLSSSFILSLISLVAVFGGQEGIVGIAHLPALSFWRAVVIRLTYRNYLFRIQVVSVRR
jgi:hypothetical protein